MLNFADGGAGDNQSPSFSFYGALRDNTAGVLIEKFGVPALLRKDSGTYDPATGLNTYSNTDTDINVVILPSASDGSNGSRSQGMESGTVQTCDVSLLISSRETVSADVIPRIGDVVVINDEELRIVNLSSVSTGGVDILYKAGVSRG